MCFLGFPCAPLGPPGLHMLSTLLGNISHFMTPHRAPRRAAIGFEFTNKEESTGWGHAEHRVLFSTP